MILTAGDLLAGLSKFAKLARSVTRSRSAIVSHVPAIKDPIKHSNFGHVSVTDGNWVWIK